MHGENELAPKLQFSRVPRFGEVSEDLERSAGFASPTLTRRSCQLVSQAHLGEVLVSMALNDGDAVLRGRRPIAVPDNPPTPTVVEILAQLVQLHGRKRADHEEQHVKVRVPTVWTNSDL